MKSKTTLIASALLLALAGCGGGGAPAPTPAAPGADANTVPDSAMESPQGFIDYLLALRKKTDDSAEPAAIKDGFKAPTEDKAEPVAVSG
jgi:hypothetical protein